MKLSAIVAMDFDGTIGSEISPSGLPWPNLPRDMAWFRARTIGKPVIMGRRTYDLLGKPLDCRPNIIMTRNVLREGWSRVHFAADIADAVKYAKGYCEGSYCEEAFVIGGAEIYNLFLPHVSRLYVTHVHGRFHGGVKFPMSPVQIANECIPVHTETHQVDERNPYAMTHCIYKVNR